MLFLNVNLNEDPGMKIRNLNVLPTGLKSVTVAATSLLLLSTPVFAEYDRGTIAEAVVLSADPVYRRVRINEPVEQCWDEAVRVQKSNGFRSHTPKILGAIIGAAVGNRFGKGRGRDVATVAGAVLGGSIGRDAQAQHRSSYHRRDDRVVYEQRCELVDQFHTEDKLEGYEVTYRYDGQVYNTFTERDPGSTIKVSVAVTPIE